MARVAWRLMGRYIDGTAWPFHALGVWLVLFIAYGGLAYR